MRVNAFDDVDMLRCRSKLPHPDAALVATLRARNVEPRDWPVPLDVFTTEPIDAGTGAIFAGVPNLILTPHIAGITRESNDRISTVTVDNVLRALRSERE